MASTSAALPSPATRDHNPSGSQMAARHSSSGRQARWQPYSFISPNSIPNKKALPCLVRPRISLLSSSSDLPALSGDTATSHVSAPLRSAKSGSKLPEPATVRQRTASSQLPTPLTSPPSVSPTLLQQTSSNYVLELSLAILASVYFQPAYQAPCKAVCPPSQGRGEASPVCSSTVTAVAVPSPNSIDHPVPASRPLTTPPYRAPPKEQITPLTPQSPQSGRITPPAAPLAPVPPTSASLPPRPPTQEVDCVLPSRSDLARHLSLLGAIGSTPCTSTSQPTTGSMRWFLTELFKRAAVPGLIIRVAAGYVLRCRTAIAHALRSVAIKSLSSPNPASPPERTPCERVLTDARRVFLAALVLACKFVFDKPYDNRSWSLISGLGSKDIGECERVVGEVLEWRLWVGAGRSPSCSS